MRNLVRQYKKKEQGVYSSVFFIVLAMVIVIAGVHVLYPRALQGVLHTAFKPLWRAEQSTVAFVGGATLTLQSKKQLVDENRELRDQLSVMQIELRTRRALEDENRVLKELISRTSDNTGIFAAVLARPGISVYDTFIIDRGTEDSVIPGSVVVVDGDVAIGHVAEVYKHTSLVVLFSAPGEKTTMMIGPERISADAIGQGGGNFITELPRDVSVEEGDAVVIPGFNGTVFGIVEKIVADPTQPFQKIIFKNPVNIATVQWVQVIPNQND